MFSEGATFSTITSGRIGFRYMPAGFCWDQSGSALIRRTGPIKPDLAILNSTATAYFAKLVAPTINYTIGDVAKVPFPSSDSKFTTTAIELVESAIELAKADSAESEITYDFCCPPRNLCSVDERKAKLGSIETRLNFEVSRLYGLTEQDLTTFEDDLSLVIADDASEQADTVDEQGDVEAQFTAESMAEKWLSYSFGTVLGRFEIGRPKSLGCGDFSAKIDEINKTISPDGILASDADQPQDIVKRTLLCLELMLGGVVAHEKIRALSDDDGDPEDLLRDWVDRRFWKYHYSLYSRRPIYWPLQSPRRKFTVWVFQEQFNKDTLFRIRDQFVQVKVRWLDARVKELKAIALTGDGRERRTAEKEASTLAETLDDVKDFSDRLSRINQTGYTPHIDDGVLLNAAPLWELLPAWPEAKKAWKELEAGKYDWAQQAMEYWPRRVKEKCETNKSFAIAHGLA